MSRISFWTWSKARTSLKNMRQASGMQIVLRLLGQALDLADYVVGEEADGSSGEGRQAGDARRGVAFERFLPEGKDIPFQLARLVLLSNFNVPAARHQLAIGLNADKGIAAHIFAAFDRLEHEGTPAHRRPGGEMRSPAFRRPP